MEKIIHFTVPERLTPVQTQTIKRARELHPTWEVKVWQDPVKPAGYMLEKYWPKANSGAQFADLLRLDLVFKWGGIYVDSDLFLLKPLDGLTNKCDCFLASEDGRYLTNALIAAVKAHPAILTLIEELLSNEPDWSVPPWITTGPELFSRVLKSNRTVTVLPRETFYSYNWDESHSKKTHRHSYGEHLWAKSWWKADQVEQLTRSLSWRLPAKRFVKLTLATVFRNWRRIKPVETLAPKQPRFYAASGELVVQTIHGFNIVVDGSDISSTPELIFGGGNETPEERFLEKTLHGGDWVLDVCSNFGSFCMLAARSVNNFGRVFVYEPNPRTLRLLSKSIAMNLMHDRVVTRAVVVGDVVENVRLAFTAEGARNVQGATESLESTVGESIETLEGRNATVIDVPCVTLDQEFPADLPIKLLKIDVQGRESAVLKGARRLLERRCIDFIMIEIPADRWGSHWSELLTQLDRHTESNYVPCTLTSDGSLVEHKSVQVALDALEGANVVLMARDQYTFRA